MSEYYMKHSGAQLDDAVSRVLEGYILPSGSIEIDKNGSYDVSAYENAQVDVPGMRCVSGTIVLNSAVTGIQEFSENEFYINVGFRPSLFIFKQPNYTASVATGAPNAQKHACVASQYRAAHLTGAGSDFFDVTYINKDSGTVITSAGSYGFRPADDGTKMIFCCNSSAYILPAGTWRWEAYE